MSDLLFECFSEEIPARMQPAAEKQLVEKITTALNTAQLGFQAIRGYSSPRHLAVIVEGLPDKQPDQIIERKGPRVSAPQAAIDGFCQSTGLLVAELEIRGEGKDATYFASKQVKGLPTAEALKPLLEEVLQGFHWPKSMRWGSHTIQWARPLQALCCLLDETIIPVQFGHLTASNQTFGHRFLAPDAITISHPRDYEKSLVNACVQIDRQTRRELIAAQLEEVAADASMFVVADEALIDEVTGLVEWPVVLHGSFESSYLSLPPEVLISEMREHQKYFACSLERPVDGTPPKLSNHFLVVTNMPTTDGGRAIVHGNGRVLRARLEDGAFYWQSDCATPLDARVKQLEGMIFHAKCGSMYDKTLRMAALAPLIAVFVPHANLSQVARAATLAKADLTSGMVGEFPELQGIMGRYYAIAQGEEENVADAIAGHYLPIGAQDQVASSPVAATVALADRLDSLVGLFAADEAPTGSKDPFALRRAALGVIRIILAHQLRIPLRMMLDKAVGCYPADIFTMNKEALVEQLMQFFYDRLRAMLKDQQIPADRLIACLAESDDDLWRLQHKSHALHAFLTSPEGADLTATYKRAYNIVQAEEKKSGVPTSAKVDAKYLQEPAEKTLYDSLTQIESDVKKQLKEENFTEAMLAIATLRAPLDQFFTDIMVNVEDAALRQNRLALLQYLLQLTQKAVALHLIEG